MASPQVVPAQDIAAEFDGITRNDFPRDFVFGTATSAYQHEGGAAKGGRGQSVWDVFTLRTPVRVADGSNGNVAIDMYTKYKEDIKMMSNMGFDAFRFSISWPRILPGGRLSQGVNKEGIDFYNDVIDTCVANGIKPFVTLFHWDLPYSLEQEYGGFLSDQIVEDFREFAELCFWEFGDRVKYWITLNEPWSYAVHGYVDCHFPPGRDFGFDSTNKSGKQPDSTTKSVTSAAGKNYIAHRDVPDPNLVRPKKSSKSFSIDYKQEPNPAKDVYTVARNMLLAHATAAQSYKTKFQDGQNGIIGITLVSHWFEPFSDDRKDIEAAKRALDFMLGWFLKPVLDGDYPESMKSNVPSGNLELFSDEEAELLKGSIDFLGLNYYTALYAANDPKPRCKDGYYKDMRVAFYSEKDLKPIGPPAGSPWLLIVPWGIQKLLKHIKGTYKSIPIYITENGVDEKNDHTITAAEACDDKNTRQLFHQFHLGYLLKAIKENKVDVRGYFAWSWADNFEWVEGYTVRFGLIYIDYMNYLRRCPKDSAKWFSNKFLVKKKKLTINDESKNEKAQKE